MDIIKEAIGLDNVNVAGVHCHIGSQIFENDPFRMAADVMLKFISDVKNTLNYEIGELNLGGGFGIKYTQKDDPEPIAVTVKSLYGEFYLSKKQRPNLFGSSADDPHTVCGCE